MPGGLVSSCLPGAMPMPGLPGGGAAGGAMPGGGVPGGAGDLRVLLLRNLVSAAEVDDQLAAEVREECTKHGAVSGVKITMEESGGQLAVLVAVEFGAAEAAARARGVMHGRMFAGRKVEADLVAVGAKY